MLIENLQTYRDVVISMLSLVIETKYLPTIPTNRGVSGCRKNIDAAKGRLQDLLYFGNGLFEIELFKTLTPPCILTGPYGNIHTVPFLYFVY